MVLGGGGCVLDCGGDDADELESSRCVYRRAAFVHHVHLANHALLPGFTHPTTGRPFHIFYERMHRIPYSQGTEWGFVCCVISDRSSPAGKAQAHTELRATVVVKGCGSPPSPPPSPVPPYQYFVFRSSCRGSMHRKAALLRRFLVGFGLIRFVPVLVPRSVPVPTSRTPTTSLTCACIQHDYIPYGSGTSGSRNRCLV